MSAPGGHWASRSSPVFKRRTMVRGAERPRPVSYGSFTTPHSLPVSLSPNKAQRPRPLTHPVSSSQTPRVPSNQAGRAPLPAGLRPCVLPLMPQSLSTKSVHFLRQLINSNVEMNREPEKKQTNEHGLFSCFGYCRN